MLSGLEVVRPSKSVVDCGEEVGYQRLEECGVDEMTHLGTSRVDTRVGCDKRLVGRCRLRHVYKVRMG